MEDYKEELDKLSNLPLPKITLIEPTEVRKIDPEKAASSINYIPKEQHSLYTTSSVFINL